MNYIPFVKNSKEREALSGILILFGFLCLAFVLASILQAGMLFMNMMKEGNLDMEALGEGMNLLTSSRSGWWTLIWMQGLSSMILFIGTSLAYWSWMEKKRFSDFNSNAFPGVSTLLFVFLIQISFLPLNALVTSWNEGLHLPEALKGLEAVMKEMERQAAEITEFLAKSDTIGQLLMNIIVIGIIAGIGEELLFRGLIQRKFIRVFGNYHLAIWAAAIIFSSIHFQFYGFFPRVLLGALFGYFYVWTGNIWVPILAHIFNNSLAVIMYHLVHKGIISKDFEKMDNIPLIYVALSTVIFAFLIYRFYPKNKENV
ncbi:Abortive infection protein [Leadbetterella byssophila DSM 17132]|uniref:Abortive infection protein n=1 Tax=Leadbetterella byssophila (strain DSM 17132 / JCM 16389 / KACC 11308 / NBRC 106382 / 4M15) TaxID=649349 RepID=E4RTW9_LEAB4|nr:CPBP family intramembrane glutamic endopeptidase [Leadbetterella byssophila]ADQ18677.1 Abortive infection protein [Leadbetterella byssophila DSM 17132]